MADPVLYTFTTAAPDTLIFVLEFTLLIVPARIAGLVWAGAAMINAVKLLLKISISVPASKLHKLIVGGNDVVSTVLAYTQKRLADAVVKVQVLLLAVFVRSNMGRYMV